MLLIKITAVYMVIYQVIKHLMTNYFSNNPIAYLKWKNGNGPALFGFMIFVELILIIASVIDLVFFIW